MECTSRSTDRYQIRQLPLIFKSVLCTKGKCHAIFTITVHNIYILFAGAGTCDEPLRTLAWEARFFVNKENSCSRSVDECMVYLSLWPFSHVI